MGNFIFGTVGSPISTPKKPGGSVGAIQQIAELGLQALELGWVQSVRVTEQTCFEIKQAASKFYVALSVHAPYFINLNADAEEWPKSRLRLMNSAYYGNLAGATDIIFHPGSYFEKPAQDVLPIAVQRLRECVEELSQAKIFVTLRPETMGKKAMLGSLEDTIYMSKEIPEVAPCIDFAHLHARGGDGTLNSTEEWIKVLETYTQALGDESLQKLHIHLSGIEYSSKGEKKHLPLQESDLDLPALFMALKQKNCSGRILCESPVMEDDALYMQKIWQEIQITD